MSGIKERERERERVYNVRREGEEVMEDWVRGLIIDHKIITLSLCAHEDRGEGEQFRSSVEWSVRKKDEKEGEKGKKKRVTE